MRLLLIDDVACPACGRPAGVRCVITHRDRRPSTPRRYPHEQRRLAFRVAKAAEPVRPAS